MLTVCSPLTHASSHSTFWFPPPLCHQSAQAKITHVSLNPIYEPVRVANLKVDFMIYTATTCYSCLPPGCAAVGKLLSESWFPSACCTQGRTSVTCHNSRMSKRELLLMKREVINQKDLTQMKFIGNQLFILISFLLLVPTLSQRHMQ